MEKITFLGEPSQDLKNFCLENKNLFKRILLLPDSHPGKALPVGFVGITEDFFYPGAFGNDIGCGISVYSLRFKQKNVNWKKLFNCLLHKIKIKNKTSREQLGTLGQGNHFLEIGSLGQELYLFIHTGSRTEGAKYNKKLSVFEKQKTKKEFDSFLTLVDYAEKNRTKLFELFLEQGLNLGLYSWKKIQEKNHNWIEKVAKNVYIHRKGAIKLVPGETFFLPLNMEDGFLVGKIEKPLVLDSFCHGAGRKIRRKECTFSYLKLLKRLDKQKILIPKFKQLVEESSEAYKSKEELLPYFGERITVLGQTKVLLSIKG